MTTIGELDSGEFSHPALFYRDEASYLAGTVPFLLDGLAVGDAVAVAVPGENLARIEAALGDSAGDVKLLDMTEAGRNPGRILSGVLRAFADAHPGPFRIIGEPVWAARSDDEYAAAVEHEALINAAFAGRAGTILCPYDTASLKPSILADAEATHPVLLDESGKWGSAKYAPDDIVSTYNQPLIAPPSAPAMEFALTTLGAARRFAADIAADAGLRGTRLDDLTLAVGELTGNSVQHGGGSGVLRVWTEAHAVICQVEDKGRLADLLAGRTPASPRQLGGRGLLLVHHVSDLVRTHRTAEGTVIRAYFRTDLQA